MKIVYLGPSPEVVIIVEGGGINALRDVPLDVDDDLGRSLCEGATFDQVKKTKPAVPAADIAAPPQEED